MYQGKGIGMARSCAWSQSMDFGSSTQLLQRHHQATSVHANLVWFPYRLVSTGVEYMWGKRENNEGSDGTASRIQFMVKYRFN